MKAIRIGLWIVAALLAGATAALFFTQAHRGTAQSGQPFGSPFQLVDQNGETITEAALQGRPSAVFFGFTHCPEVCPTTLYELSGYQQKILEEGGEPFQIVFVTVDPERDTPSVLKEYVEALTKDVRAVTGDPEKVASMLKAWGIYSKKVGDGDDYTMDHTATTFLIDDEGQLDGTISYDENPETALKKLEKLTGV
ncbi:MAG: SCO family protein [Fulvimarina manganoxydans]|uniref:SCO family protein n=1 Tax=Fulvimarina manganoxydans TaxID=937218 RepID=UPI002354FB11|nr:SCO family protein [Fulvimarina manganoxydans]MCK5934646.1 SCO family protein [Fulvimarina manganoxydans]